MYGKRGGFKLCIDYYGLNQIIVNYLYSLPPVQLHNAKVFVNLDLCSVCDLMGIYEGDEWKHRLGPLAATTSIV